MRETICVPLFNDMKSGVVVGLLCDQVGFSGDGKQEGGRTNEGSRTWTGRNKGTPKQVQCFIWDQGFRK
jgi:hypothetical protein